MLSSKDCETPMRLAQYASIPVRGAFHQRSFTPADQAWFAAYSADVNPIHVAPHLAGRTHTGEMVVHGAHLALWLLEEIAAHPVLNGLACLSVRFLKPCHVGDMVRPEILCLESGVISARAFVEGAPIVEMELLPAISAPLRYAQATIPPPAQPHRLGAHNIETASGEIGLPRASAEARQHFPHVTERLGDGVPALIAALSQLVGMHCPGRHSLFSGFSLTFAEPEAALPGELSYRVTRWDPRFHLVTMTVACGQSVQGAVRAFLRQDTVKQPSMRDIMQHVQGTPFRGQEVLIVGGSRGIGETAAKLLAAGGARVSVTYCFSRIEAEGLAAEIETAGGHCRILKFDVTQAPAPQLARVSPHSAVLYFATPSIGVRRLKWFDSALLKSFEDYYVGGFALLCEVLAEWDRPLRILYPSTSILDEFAKDLLEYSIAKSAGEELCRRIPEIYPNLSIVSPRLPRLATDQNAGFLPHRLEPVVKVLHPILMEMLGAKDAKESQLSARQQNPEACA
jgi:acyl dehydratase